MMGLRVLKICQIIGIGKKRKLIDGGGVCMSGRALVIIIKCFKGQTNTEDSMIYFNVESH